MELKKLEYLESVYRLHSFTGAAKEHYISQPSISSAIQGLETELGVTLVNRNTKPLTFTRAGREFMKHVYTILSAVEDAEKAMMEFSGVAKQTINFAIFSTVGNWMINKVYSEIYDLFPNINISVSEDTLKNMMSGILTERLNIAYTLIPDYIDYDLYEVIPMHRAELCLALPKSHPYTTYENISLEQLKAEKLLIFPSGSLIRSRVEAEFHKLHMTPDFITIAQPGTMSYLVAQDYGIAFVLNDPSTSTKQQSDITVLPLRDPIYFQTGVILKKDVKHTAVIDSIISYLREII